MPDNLLALIEKGNVAILSGAGMSTGSGIPDYRGPTGAARPATPMTFQEFVGSALARQRYWARSHIGWRFISAALPNSGHRAVAELQAQGLVRGIITQNVDGLHQAGGAKEVIELHGSLADVVCLGCGESTARQALEVRLTEVNPGWQTGSHPIKPDGDVDLEDVSDFHDFRDFHMVDCATCGGLLKPDVVFFGETVPRDRADRAFSMVDNAASLLVLGSSLKVMSGYRFVLRARKLGIAVAIVNQGRTRGDAQADVRVDAELSATLTRLATSSPLSR